MGAIVAGNKENRLGYLGGKLVEPAVRHADFHVGVKLR
jgi:hypothetical protein